MKKIIALAAFVSLSLVSCGDDDKPQSQPNPVDNTKTLLTAKWNLVKSEFVINGNTQTEDLKQGDCNYDYYDLKSDGSKDEISHDSEDNCSTTNWPGTWSYNPSTKEITLIDSDDDYTLVTEVISITATDLKIKMITADGEPAPNGVEVYLYLKK